MPIAYIVWIDSQHVSGWKYPEDMHFNEEDMLQETVGFLFRETDYSYAVVQSKSIVINDDKGQVDSMMEIPKCSVREMKILNV